MKLTIKSVLLAAVASTAMLTTPAVMAADFVMKISSPAPKTDVDGLSAWFDAFEAGVEKRSEGRIDVQLFPASQLGPIPATVEGVAMGTIEMTVPIIGFLSSVDPRFQVLDAAGVFEDELHVMRTMSDPAVKEMISDFGSRANVEPLFVLANGRSVVIAKDRVENSEDFRGLKMRTGGASPLVNEPMSALGAAPVAMPLGEVLPGIQTGTIDAATLGLAVLVGFKFADVASEATYMPGNFIMVGGLVNKDFLASIGPELEAIVREEAEAAKVAYADRLRNGIETLEGVWAKQGGSLTTMSDADAKAVSEIITPVVANIVGANEQMTSDFAVLTEAAERNK